MANAANAEVNVKVTNTSVEITPGAGRVLIDNLTLADCMADLPIQILNVGPFDDTDLLVGEMAMATIMARLNSEATDVCIRCTVTGEAFDAPQCPTMDDFECCVSPRMIPTLSQWGMVVLILSLGFLIVSRRRRVLGTV